MFPQSLWQGSRDPPTECPIQLPSPWKGIQGAALVAHLSLSLQTLTVTPNALEAFALKFKCLVDQVPTMSELPHH